MSPARKTKAGPPEGEPATAQVLAKTYSPKDLSVSQEPSWATGRTPVFVLLVRYPRTVWRRAFLTLAAAQKYAERAEEKGHAAEIVLCRLEPMTAAERDEVLADVESQAQFYRRARRRSS
ncbi:hypothetical protein [Kineococcus sp. G2]|uniref:hypothetical protein n=1 Tax=Kineococcus sp. G2 TaxID=3127484 RepID=UPI00301BE933